MKNNIVFLICFFTTIIAAQTNQQYLDSASYYYFNRAPQKQIEVLDKIDSLELNKKELALFKHNLGRYYNSIEESTQAYYQLFTARKLFNDQNLLENEFEALDDLIYCINSTATFIEKRSVFVEELCKLAQKLSAKEKSVCLHYQMSISVNEGDLRNAIIVAREGLQLSTNNELSIKQEFIANLATLHQNLEHKDSALFYFKKSINHYESNNDSIILSQLYNNLGTFYQKNNDHLNAIDYFNLADSITNRNQYTSLKRLYAKNKAVSYTAIEDFENATKYYKLYTKLSDSTNSMEYAQKLSEFETKYESSQNEKENLKLKADKEEQRAQIYAISGSGTILILIILFFYNNQRKKKLLALKETEIEKGRADTLLKNHELATIDAMISGQEKERKRLADELHDDLGSTLTTVRLYFENLKGQMIERNSQEVFNRTEKLLEEAYEKIRNMSHTRHNGILASKGLIPTIESLAHKITESGKIKVEVIHHGLNQSLENSLELTIFRIIQELLNNVIKHAQAQNVVISLTAYENQLNIMVEDDGIGFKTTLLNNNSGAGLYTIEQRIESLDGSMEIDSHNNHGTTINLDIPII